MKKKHSQDLARTLLIIGIMIIGVVILFKVLGFKVVRSSSQASGEAPSSMSAPPRGLPAQGSLQGTGAGSTEVKQIAVRASKISSGSIRNYSKFQGNVIADSEIKIYPKMDGKIIERKVSVGSQISVGGVIALVDPSEVGQKYLPNPVESTVAGTVLSIPIHEGDTVTTSTVVATVGNISRVQIETYVPEKYISNLRVGTAAEITFDAIPGTIFAAQIIEMNPVVDPESRTVRVRLRFSREDPRVLVGMSASINMVIEQHNNVLIVPRDAVIQTTDEGSYVFVIKSDNTVERRTVTLGIESEDDFEIKTGLKAGDSVVTDGKNSVSDGSSVVIINSASAAKTGASQ